MNRRKLLGLIPAGVLLGGGIFAIRSIPAKDNQTKETETAKETNLPMSTIEDLKTLERNPSEVTPFKLSKSHWNKVLEDDRFYVLRKEGTERAFTSPLNNEKREGEYVCAGCGLALFKSDTKYDSGTGWPSFFDAIEGRVSTKTDFKIGYPRKEYHCARCGGHTATMA